MTPDNTDYRHVKYSVHAVTSMMFKVKACHEAIIALFDHIYSTTAYEIIIGDTNNQKSRIKKYIYGNTMVEVGE